MGRLLHLILHSSQQYPVLKCMYLCSGMVYLINVIPLDLKQLTLLRHLYLLLYCYYYHYVLLLVLRYSYKWLCIVL